MKNFIFLITLLFTSQITSAQQGSKCEVYWSLGCQGNSSFWDLSFKVLQAISYDQIQAYDKDMKILKKYEIERRIPEKLLKLNLTDVETKIALENGDFSVLKFIETKYTEDELVQMLIDKKDYMQYFKKIKRKKIKPFETKDLKIELHEELILDTTVTTQRGTVKFIRLLIPKYYTKSKKDELLCQVKYEDVIKLNLTPEQQNLDQHKFVVSTWDGDITVTIGNEIYKLSETITVGENPDRKLLDQSIFRYFKKSIKLFNPHGGRTSDY